MDEIRDEEGTFRKGIMVMEKYKVFSIVMVIAGFIILTVGIFFLDFILSILGGLLVGLSVFVMEIKESEKKEKSILELMEKREGSVLSKTKITKEKVIPILTSVIITVIIFTFLYILLRRNFMGTTTVSYDKAVNDGCAKMKISRCEIDSERIYVTYDVNKDGMVGRIGDSLYNLLNQPPNVCNETCIRKLCNCQT